jgi:hypothetical protein
MPVLKPTISYFLQGSTPCGSSVAGVSFVQKVKIMCYLTVQILPSMHN